MDSPTAPAALGLPVVFTPDLPNGVVLLAPSRAAYERWLDASASATPLYDALVSTTRGDDPCG